MYRSSYGRDTGTPRRVQVRQPVERTTVRPPGREDGPRPSPESPAIRPEQPASPAPPTPEALQQHEVVELRDTDLLRHRGRREDDRGPERRTREQREQHVLELLGTFRVLTRRSLVEHCFDGHPFAAGRVLPALLRDGLVAVNTLPSRRKGYQVFSLTGAGRDRVACLKRKRRRRGEEDDEAEQQRYWTGLADMRQLQHDHHVFDAVMQDTEDVRERGGRIRRVRLESELRGLLAAAGETARRTEGAAGAERARRNEAVRIGLRVFAENVPLPDALVEIEGADGSRSVRAVEVVTGAYTQVQVREKQRAGFRLYRIPRFRTEGKRRRFGTLGREDPFPLSWGSGR